MSQLSISNSQVNQYFSLLRRELLRKIIHSSLAFILPISFYSIYLAFFLLSFGSICYLTTEFIRVQGYHIPLISRITTLASRVPEKKSIIWGPITLSIGAMLAFTFFSPLVASIAIISLAFGDGAASLVGKAIGQHRPAFLFGKSIEGSLACFFATIFALYYFTGNILISIIIAAVTMIAESLPLNSFDNIFIPLSTGSVATLFLLFF